MPTTSSAIDVPPNANGTTEREQRERARHEIGRAPSGDVGDDTRQRTRGQQADHGAALRGAHRASALAGTGQCGRSGDHA